MNCKAYRIVFNRRRGCMMAVAETARACGTMKGQVTLAVAALLAVPAIGQIVADPQAPRNRQATVVSTANGLPQVNIQTPSAAGVSRNTFSQFDVQAPGAILNNSPATVQTQLGGWVQGNPWLAAGSARVILGEVNASNPSQIRGYVEVAGPRAEVVIANPSGIAVSGGGFINASGVTLTTGTPVTGPDGALQGFRVREGRVTIDGNGLDTGTADYTAILTRAAQISGGLWARDLTIVTGSYDISGAQVTAQSAASAAPRLGIDVTQLGGMYADRIHLVATEAGVGVSNAGVVAAGAGLLRLDTQGNLQNTGQLIATAGLAASAASVVNSGTLYAGGSSTIAAAAFTNAGVVAAAGDQSVQAMSVVNTGTLAAGVAQDGTFAATGALGVTASASLRSSGQHVAGRDITLSAPGLDLQGSLTNAPSVTLTASADSANLQGATVVGERVTISTPGQLVTDAARISAGQLAVVAGALSNVGGRITARAPFELQLPGALDNTRGTLYGGSTLTARAQSIDNTDGVIQSEGVLGMAAGGRLDNTRGAVASGAAVNLTASTITNGRGMVFGAQGLKVNAVTIASSGTLASGAEVSLTGALKNEGLVQAAGELFATGPTDNSGQIVSGGASRITGTLTNAGLVQASTSLTIDTQGALLTNAAGGQILAGQSLDIHAGRTDNLQGSRIASAGTATLNVDVLDNSGSTIVSNGVLSVNAKAVVNRSGLIQSVSDLSLGIEGGLLDNSGTAGAQGIVSGGQLSVQAGALDNTAGRVVALGTAAGSIRAASVRNEGGLIYGAADFQITNTGNLSNTQGTIAAQRDLTVTSGSVSDAGKLRANRDLVLTVGADLSLNADNVAASGNATVSSAASIVNSGAQTAGADLRFGAAGSISNEGSLSAGGTLWASAGTAIVNTRSMVGASIELHAGQMVANRGPDALTGATDPKGSLTLLAPVIENADDLTATDTAASATILGLGRVTLAGARDALGNLSAASRIVNRSGLIESGSDMVMVADQVLNTRGQLRMSSTFDQPASPAELDAAGITLSGQVGQVNTPNPDQIGGVYIDPPHGGAMNSDDWYTTYQGTASRNSLVAISPRARIVTGGSLDASGVGKLQNRWSDILAGGAIDVGSAQVDQDSWRGAAQPQLMVNYSGDYNYRTYKGAWWTQSFANDVRYYRLPSDYDSRMTAGAALSGSGGSLVNGSTGAGTLPFAGTVGTVQVSGALATVGSPAAPQFVSLKPSLPASSLFHPAQASAGYYVETDPRFTQYRQWISSDYLLQALSVDPSLQQKRFGDGLVEQRLVREQLVELTGRMLLPGMGSEEEQYKALMASAVTQAQTLSLVPGVALSAAQLAILTSDIVWLVEQDVTLADGRVVRAWVPQVYLSASSTQLKPDGALIAAHTIDLRNQSAITNTGTLQATGDLRLQSLQDLNSSLGTLRAGASMDLSARQNIDLTGARVTAGALKADAGRDILIASATRTTTGTALGIDRTTTRLARVGSVQVAGDASLAAGRDLTVQGASVGIGGAGALAAGRDLQIGQAQTRDTQSASRQGGAVSSDFQRGVASTVTVGGSTSLQAGRDIGIQGSQVDLATQGGAARVLAQRDVSVTAAKDRETINNSWSVRGSKGHLNTSEETVKGASLSSGGSLTIGSGRDGRWRDRKWMPGVRCAWPAKVTSSSSRWSGATP